MRGKRLWRLASRPIAAALFNSRLFRAVSGGPRRLAVVGLAGGAAFNLGGCAQQPPVQRVAHSKEYFPSSIYGKASPRVVAYGEPVPRGGGVYMVGKPYSVAGHTYYPSEKQYSAMGYASWYGEAFHGRRTANGEIYDIDSISAAHPTMPLPSYARVTNLTNHYSMIVRVNDRGPFDSSRVMDVSRRTAELLDFHKIGTARVKVDYIGPAGLEGSDDSKLIATLRTDGPARLDGGGQGRTMVAEAAPQPAPVRTALAEPVRGDGDGQGGGAASGSVPLPVSRPFVGTAPLPPARPFDLGTIPGAGVRIAARSRQTN